MSGLTIILELLSAQSQAVSQEESWASQPLWDLRNPLSWLLLRIRPVFPKSSHLWSSRHQLFSLISEWAEWAFTIETVVNNNQYLLLMCLACHLSNRGKNNSVGWLDKTLENTNHVNSWTYSNRAHPTTLPPILPSESLKECQMMKLRLGMRQNSQESKVREKRERLRIGTGFL